MKKHILYTIGVLATLTLTQCGKKIDEVAPQQNVLSETALNNTDNIQKAVTGVYGIVRGSTMLGCDIQMAADLLGGNGDLVWRGTFFAQRDLFIKNIVSDNGIATATWITSYQAINAANNVLENVDKIGDIAKRNLAKGEVLFLRGLTYFELIRLFAQAWNPSGSNDGLGVPLMLKANDLSRPSRATIAQIYAQVIADITEAETLLPNSNGNRANKFAAKALLARIYLQQSNYAQALAKANDVITNGGYALNTTVTEMFTNNNTKEAIFEIQQDAVNNAGRTNSGLATFYANTAGFGRGDVEITKAHLALYDTIQRIDKRLTELFYDGVKQKSSAKWLDPTKNINILRLAEMLLTRAECNSRLSSNTGATPLADVNAIRNRAGLPNLTTVDLDAILRERRLELCFEGHRIHEVKRLGLNVVSANPAFNYSATSPKLVLPIPLREMNVNPNLVQNPGY